MCPRLLLRRRTTSGHGSLLAGRVDVVDGDHGRLVADRGGPGGGHGGLEAGRGSLCAAHGRLDTCRDSLYAGRAKAGLGYLRGHATSCDSRHAG